MSEPKFIESAAKEATAKMTTEQGEQVRMCEAKTEEEETGEYEKLRIANIRRHAEMGKELGIVGIAELLGGLEKKKKKRVKAPVGEVTRSSRRQLGRKVTEEENVPELCPHPEDPCEAGGVGGMTHRCGACRRVGGYRKYCKCEWCFERRGGPPGCRHRG